MSENMMTCGECDELFLDYFENTLSESSRARFDEHVSSCVRCQSLIRDVNEVRDEAAALPDISPSRDLWKGIESRIQPQVRSIAHPRSASISRTWLAAAAALLVIATSGVTYLATSRSMSAAGRSLSSPTLVAAPQVAVAPASGAASQASSPTASAEDKGSNESSSAVESHKPVATSDAASRTSLASASSAPSAMTASELAFAGEITQLQHVLVERRAQLDPATVKVVEDNLKLIDTAVKRARSALAKDPASGFLTRQLDNALQKKVDLLRTAALLPAST